MGISLAILMGNMEAKQKNLMVIRVWMTSQMGKVAYVVERGTRENGHVDS